MVERASISAPCFTSARTAEAWSSAAAHISAVSPIQLSRALTFAPASTSTSMASGRPVRAAIISTVCPSVTMVFGSAPATSSTRIMVASPLVAASDSGVTP